MKENKYPEAIIADLASVFAQKDSNAPGYMSGPKLTAFFNTLGFADTYKYPGIGIVTPDASGLSRTQYAVKRLTDINNALRLPEALTSFLELNAGINSITANINSIFERYKIPNPIVMDSEKGRTDIVNVSPVQQPQLGLSNQLMPETKAPAEKVVTEHVSGSVKSKISDPYFDQIPTGRKIAFISYSWDDETHKKWVLQLAMNLYQKGIVALLDQFLPAGYSLTHFMNKGLSIADKVIVIGTPQYKEKSMKSLSGGVSYEESIIHTDLMENIASVKFLPVVRAGDFSSSLPTLLRRRVGLDFTDDSKYDSLLSEIVREIYDVPKYPIPVLGPVPTFDYDDLSPREIAELKRPESDFRKKQDRKWLDRLLGAFSFDLMYEYLSNAPRWVDERVFISIDLWNSIIGNPTFRIYDPNLNRIITEFHNLWHEIEMTGLKFYSSELGTHKVRFHGIAHDDFISTESENAFNKIMELQLKMQPLLKEMASYIQDRFEIDVEETSSKFLKSLSR